jgi:hypothetical protein
VAASAEEDGGRRAGQRRCASTLRGRGRDSPMLTSVSQAAEPAAISPSSSFKVETNSRCGRASWTGRRRAAGRGPGRVEGSGRASESTRDQVEKAAERQPAGRSWRPAVARPSWQSLRSGVSMMPGMEGSRRAGASGSARGSGRGGRTGEIRPAAAAHRASPWSRERAGLTRIAEVGAFPFLRGRSHT